MTDHEVRDVKGRVKDERRNDWHGLTRDQESEWMEKAWREQVTDNKTREMSRESLSFPPVLHSRSLHRSFPSYSE